MPGRLAGLLVLPLALGVVLALSRPLPPPPLSPSEPVLGERAIQQALADLPEVEDELLERVSEELAALGPIPGRGASASEYLLVTAGSGTAAVALLELARTFAVDPPSRSLVLAVAPGAGGLALPGAVACHIHLDYRLDTRRRPAIQVAPAGTCPPLWLRQLARAAAARERGAVVEGAWSQFRQVVLAAGAPGQPFPAVALKGHGPGPEYLADLGRTAERLLRSLDELPAIPRPRLATLGRASSLYLVARGRYVPAPVLWLAQAICFLPLGLAVGRGAGRGRRSRGPLDDAAILTAVQTIRHEQGKLPPVPGETRVQRRRRRLQGIWPPLVAEAARWCLAFGGLSAIWSGFRREVAAAVAAAGLAAAGWLASRAARLSWEEGHWALLALLGLATVTAAVLTGGNPVTLVLFLPAAWCWPALAPGGSLSSCLLALLGLAGAVWLTGQGWAGLVLAPWPLRLILLAAVALTVGALRLAVRSPEEPAEGD